MPYMMLIMSVLIGGGYFNRCTCVVGTKSDGYEECNSRKRTMVGYGSIVTKSLPENCIAAGSPARVIKRGILWKR